MNMYRTGLAPAPTYEPGTAAVVATVRGQRDVRVYRGKGHGWHSFDLLWYPDNDVTDVRPLFVLDLEYPGLVVNVLRAIAKDYRIKHGCNVEQSQICEEIAQQIEEPTRPPKPKEPTTLGAVATERDGEKWVRLHSELERPWTHALFEMDNRTWDELDVAEVTR